MESTVLFSSSFLVVVVLLHLLRSKIFLSSLSLSIHQKKILFLLFLKLIYSFIGLESGSRYGMATLFCL